MYIYIYVSMQLLLAIPTNEDYHVPGPIGPATLKCVDLNVWSVESHMNDYCYLYTLPPMNLILRICIPAMEIACEAMTRI